MLQVLNYGKSYKTKTVIKNLSLTINDGEIYGFIGHNGAGKSTTIKSIVGILSFERGRILIDGKNIETYPIECKRDIGYIPEEVIIYDNITGLDYLNFVADAFNISIECRKTEIEKYSNMFDMQDSLNNKVASYSHGMKQKLVLISVFMHTPRVLILDEPFNSLDAKAIYNVKNIIKEFAMNGSTILFSTHILELIEKLCDRIGIIKNGDLIAEGKLEDIKKESSLEEIFLELKYDEHD